MVYTFTLSSCLSPLKNTMKKYRQRFQNVRSTNQHLTPGLAKKHFVSQDIKGLMSLGQMAASNTGGKKCCVSIEWYGFIWYDTLCHGLILFYGLCVEYISMGLAGREPIVGEPSVALSLTAQSSPKNFSRHVFTRQEAHTLCGHWPMAAGLPGCCNTLKHINT